MTSKEADKLVLDQSILRHKERQDRQKREIPIPEGPGWTSKGSIFDCSRPVFERALRAYWDRLYVGWNPMKNDGRGCWEVWQRPSKKTPILAYHDEHTGMKIYKTEYVPNDFEHWVADLDHLNLNFIEKLRRMDSWENKQLISDHDYEFEKAQQKIEQKENEAIRYIARHEKNLFRAALDHYKSK